MVRSFAGGVDESAGFKWQRLPESHALRAWRATADEKEREWLVALRDEKDKALSEICKGHAATLSGWQAKAYEGLKSTPIVAHWDTDEFMQQQYASNSWRRRRCEAYLAEREVSEALQDGAAEAARRRLALPIELSPAAGIAGVVFGTNVATGEDHIKPINKLQHMLISGVPGSGKSVLLHAIVRCLLRSPDVDNIIIGDLKGGLEFYHYTENPKVQCALDFKGLVPLVDSLTLIAEQRQVSMLENRQQLWPHRRTVLLIDEYGEVQTAIDTAVDREEKATAKRTAANLLSLSRRARALGIVMICAIQKHTTDMMDSSLLNNLTWRLVLRTANKRTAQALLELDDMDELSVKPIELPDGRYYFHDARSRNPVLLQAQVAPGVKLG